MAGMGVTDRTKTLNTTAFVLSQSVLNTSAQLETYCEQKREHQFLSKLPDNLLSTNAYATRRTTNTFCHAVLKAHCLPTLM